MQTLFKTGEPLQLSSDQIAAAKACGIAFLPASPDQVQRLSMQLKVFRIDGQPYLATRDGGFFETAATLERLIAARLEEQQQADLAAWEASGAALLQEIEVVAPPAPAVLGPRVPVPEVPAVNPADEAPAPVLPVPPMEVTPLAARRPPRDAHSARWVMAGAARRGRAAQHWSARRKA